MISSILRRLRTLPIMSNADNITVSESQSHDVLAPDTSSPLEYLLLNVDIARINVGPLPSANLVGVDLQLNGREARMMVFLATRPNLFILDVNLYGESAPTMSSPQIRQLYVSGCVHNIYPSTSLLGHLPNLRHLEWSYLGRAEDSSENWRSLPSLRTLSMNVTGQLDRAFLSVLRSTPKLVIVSGSPSVALSALTFVHAIFGSDWHIRS
jgi:hypothetical protein